MQCVVLHAKIWFTSGIFPANGIRPQRILEMIKNRGILFRSAVSYFLWFLYFFSNFFQILTIFFQDHKMVEQNALTRRNGNDWLLGSKCCSWQRISSSWARRSYFRKTILCFPGRSKRHVSFILIFQGVTIFFRPYEIKFEPSYLIENSNKMEKMFYHQQKQEKEFIKFQYPEDRFAPMEELGVVCKSKWMKFSAKYWRLGLTFYPVLWVLSEREWRK